MLRLPRFRLLAPRSAREAAYLVAEHGARAMFVAGGTDLFPKLKRRQFDVDVLVTVAPLPENTDVKGDSAGGFDVGAAVTLREASEHADLRSAFPGYTEAAGSVSSPPLRNVGTVGGNLCVDTRCNYYDMTYEWRRAAGFCLKKDGDICLVAPGSPRCWALSSSDTAPVAVALGATVVLTGPDGERQLPVSALYRDDGIDYLEKRPFELVTRLQFPPAGVLRTSYVKLRRRGSIDFPIAGAAVAMRLVGAEVASCRVVLSAVASHPVEAHEADAFLTGRELNAETIRETAVIAAKHAKPLDNADLNHYWRKRMVPVIVEQALQRAAAQQL